MVVDLVAQAFHAMVTFNTINATYTFVKRKATTQPNILLDASNEILSKIKTLNGKTDQQDAIELHSGFTLLADAMNTENLDIRREQLGLARSRFANLVAHSKDGNGMKPNSYYRVGGYMGNFMYFILSEEKLLAAQQPFLAAIDHPILAVYMFGRQAFPDELVKEVEELVEIRKKIGFETKEDANRHVKWMGEYQRKLNKETTTDQYISGALGIAAGVIVGAVAGVIWPPGAPVAGFATFRAINNSSRDVTIVYSQRDIEIKQKQFDNFFEKLAELENKIADSSRVAYDKIKGITPPAYEKLLGSSYY